MNDPEISSSVLGNLVGGGVVAGSLILVLWKVFSKVADRFIAALDRVAKSVDDHTKTDLEHHGKVSEQLAGLRGELVGISYEREHTPVNQPFPARAKTPARGIRPPRPGTHHDEEE